MQDFHELPKLRDSLSYLYIEHAVLERKDSAILVLQETGRTMVPAADLCVLMLGPGTSLTHAAVDLLVEDGCSVIWCGEDSSLFYAQGMGETHKNRHIMHQAAMVSDPVKRLEVVLKMYEKRFGYAPTPDLSLDQIRGMEGVRMRNAYADISRKTEVPWTGRKYDRKDWVNADPVNRALSAANAVLNGICHAGIVSGGYSPALGFLHTGWMLSFVYDIADLYKVEFTIPIAFEIVKESPYGVETRARMACRERFREGQLLERILPDIDSLMGIKQDEELPEELVLPDYWWQPGEEAERKTSDGRNNP